MRVLNAPSHGAKPVTGTTVVACAFDGGVVLGCDTRMSLGRYVCNRSCEKAAQLYDNVYMLRSGSASDAQLVSDYGELVLCGFLGYGWLFFFCFHSPQANEDTPLWRNVLAFCTISK